MLKFFIGVRGFTRSIAITFFFFSNTIAEKNIYCFTWRDKLLQHKRGLMRREMLRVSHLACCLCKQMADKQKIMDGWMDG